MMSPELSAIIVNFNAGGELRHALTSIANEMAGREWEAVVVDNASVDGSQEIALEFSPHTRLICNDTNVGFGRGVNQGVAASRSPLILIINPDCRLEAGALAELRRALDAFPSCAIAGPRILDPDGTEQGSARGDPDMLTGLFGRNTRLRRLFPGLAVSRRNVVDVPGGRSAKSGAHIVDWVSGACMLARRDALLSVKGFDERFFLYWEDADLCRRLRARGYEIRYAPGATAVHQVGQSSRTARAASIRAFHEGAYLYYATHVATGRMNPKRPIARLLLALRCRWRLRSAA
jgi:N-acetylglucosaminyl-diphospho-decaprenol L-rhamnosyltransferase